jgi:hypothetical protein
VFGNWLFYLLGYLFISIVAALLAARFIAVHSIKDDLQDDCPPCNSACAGEGVSKPTE